MSHAAEVLPLLVPRDASRPVALREGRRILLEEFCAHVAALERGLPAGACMINLCEDRYSFLAACAAALSAGHTILLPPSRAEQVLQEIEADTPGCYRWDDAAVQAAGHANAGSRVLCGEIRADQLVMIGFTSGSTGRPRQHPKTWRSLSISTALNARTIREALGGGNAQPWLLATVPPQHMYGMEMSVLLPLIGGMAVHAGRPLFPADIASALSELPAPRILVSTPFHLRAIVQSAQEFAPVALVVCATAPLDQALAAAVERKLSGRVLEVFGSTETCVIARRHTAQEALWRSYPGIEFSADLQGTRVHAPWFVQSVLLSDHLELYGAGKFRVLGRHADMVEVAGKRASLADLTRRLLAIEGVKDAVVFQPDPDAAAPVRRVAALVVAPGLSVREILAQLTSSVDAAFMPRPLLLVEALPRNELGKLPRERLLYLLRGNS